MPRLRPGLRQPSAFGLHSSLQCPTQARGAMRGGDRNAILFFSWKALVLTFLLLIRICVTCS